MKCSREGRCPELAGGGLVRSAGGWREVKKAYRTGMRLTGDERIFGDGNFVNIDLSEAEEQMERGLRNITIVRSYYIDRTPGVSFEGNRTYWAREHLEAGAERRPDWHPRSRARFRAMHSPRGLRQAAARAPLCSRPFSVSEVDAVQLMCTAAPPGRLSGVLTVVTRVTRPSRHRGGPRNAGRARGPNSVVSSRADCRIVVHGPVPSSAEPGASAGLTGGGGFASRRTGPSRG